MIEVEEKLVKEYHNEIRTNSIFYQYQCTEKIEREVCIISAIGIENSEMQSFLGSSAGASKEPT